MCQTPQRKEPVPNVTCSSVNNTCQTSVSSHSFCDTNIWKCVCQDKFADVDCSYKRKSKITAFLFSFFWGGFGADRFYLGFINLGVAKLLITLNICLLPFYPFICICCLTDRRFSLTYQLSILGVGFTLLAIWLWWLLDWILIISGKLSDSNGFGLA